MNIQEIKQKIIKGIFWLGLTRFIGQILSWLITIILVRLLSPTDYGLIGMAMVFIALFNLFYEMGIGSAIIQKKNLDDEELSSCFWIILFSGFFFYIIIFLLAPFIAHFFNNKRLIAIIRVLGLALIPASISAVPFNLLSRELDFDKRAKIQLIRRLSNALTALSFALMRYGVWSLVFGYLSGHIVSTIMVYWFYHWKPHLFLSIRKIKYLMKFGLNVLGSRIFYYIYNRSDSLIIGKYLGEVSLGYYTVALQLSRFPLDKVTSIINLVSYPVFSKFQDDDKTLSNCFLKMTKFIL